MNTPALVKTPRAFSSAICTSCRQRLLPPAPQRHFSTTTRTAADNGPPGPGSSFSRDAVRRPNNDNNSSPFAGQSIDQILDAPTDSLLTSQFASNLSASTQMDQVHRLHVFATRHNTHITLVQPTKLASQTISSNISSTSTSAADQKKQVDVLMSLSAGNIGFRKAGRGSYDAAYQLTSFVLKQIQERGLLRDIRSLEVVLRGFGSGREAASKALLGTEGRLIRGKITSVVDATRLKQGGTRSKKPRRLG